MSVVIGVHPGGRSRFAVCALFWQGRLPAMFFTSRAYSSVQEVLEDIVGVVGEWGNINVMAVDAPLTWAASVGGLRECDKKLRAHLPSWVPRTWVRAPNGQSGAATIQGPALVWALAREAKQGLLQLPEFCEAHARASLARIANDLRTAVIGYRKRDLSQTTREKHLQTLVDRLIDTGLVKLEVARPASADELDALVCAVTALGHAYPESGLIVRELPGDQIRPVGKRSLYIIDGLP
ncbi:DUF429 domain-containing protein [Myxococcota bacterium]